MAHTFLVSTHPAVLGRSGNMPAHMKDCPPCSGRKEDSRQYAAQLAGFCRAHGALQGWLLLFLCGAGTAKTDGLPDGHAQFWDLVSVSGF